MKIILEPTVTVIARTEYLGHPTKKVPVDGLYAEKLGAHAAKVCYNSFGETGRSVRENQLAIIKERHGSVLEHATVSLHIEGITRALSLELNRHRPLAISQRSTRYTNESDAAIVLEPFYATMYRRMADSDKTQPAAERTLILEHLDQVRESFAEYTHEVAALIELNPRRLEGVALRKWARGKARNVLPHGLATEGVWTFNFRALRYFIEARSGRGAEDEIRRLATAVYDAVRPLAPVYFEDYVHEIDPTTGLVEYTTAYPKI
jgi:thymidylate synthase (FAD)